MLLPFDEAQAVFTRRFFGKSAMGIGTAALASLLGREAWGASRRWTWADRRRRTAGAAAFRAEGEARDLPFRTARLAR
jgi:hypothetical protein